MSPVNPALLPASIRKIEAAYKAKTGGTGRAIQVGEDHDVVTRISTGSYMLDWATGGGIPIGRFSRLYGGYSSGKSMTCWRVIANAQKMGKVCAYYNIEKQFEPKFARAMGVDVDHLIIVQGTVMEHIGQKLEELLKSVHVHVLDSCSSAVSQEELAASVTDWQMGLKARVWGKIFYRVLERFDEHENCVVLCDQVRDDFTKSTVSPPGGRFLEHTSSLSLFFKKGSWLFRRSDGSIDYETDQTIRTLADTTEANGMEVQVRVEKSRVGRPFRNARLRYDFGERDGEGNWVHPPALDVAYELAKAAQHYGVVQQSGSWYRLPDGSNVQGLNKLRLVCMKSPELQTQVLQALQRDW